MPFLAAIPALAGAFGATLPTALAVGLPATAGALGVAQGIAQKDPLKAVMGAASAIPAVGAATNAASSAASGTTATIPASLGDTVTKGLNLASSVPNSAINPSALSAINSASVPAAQVPLLQQIGAGISGVGNAASGVMALINAFKDNGASSGSSMRGMGGGGLSAAGGANAGSLPGVPSLQAQSPGQVPKYNPADPKANNLLLQLLGAYKG